MCWLLCPQAPAHIWIHPSAGLCQIPWFTGAEHTAPIHLAETSSAHLSEVPAPLRPGCGDAREQPCFAVPWALGAVGLQQ